MMDEGHTELREQIFHFSSLYAIYTDALSEKIHFLMQISHKLYVPV